MQSSDIHLTPWQHVLLSTESIKRLLLACALGSIVGIERELRHKMSGLRTNLLICMGAALFTILSIVIAGDASPNKGQIAANIVQGIGFLGAGLILHNRARVHGLTSAATVFVVAAIGMACGAGMYLEAFAATVLVFVALQVVGQLETRIGVQRYSMIYEVRAEVGEMLSKDLVGEAHAAALANASETARHRMATSVLHVLDAAGIRLVLEDKENLAGVARLTFPVLATRSVHEQLLSQLRASNATDQVVVFRDPEDE